MMFGRDGWESFNMHCIFMVFGRVGGMGVSHLTALCVFMVCGRGFERVSFDMHCVLCSWFIHPTVINIKTN